jgi:hypothetical protein
MTLLKDIFNASITQGPSESIKEEIWMNTYDVVTMKVPSGEVGTKISILPDGTAIKFFIITSDKYSPTPTEDEPEPKLEYKTKSDDPNSKGIVLDIPHVLIGKSVLDKIGDFSELTIINKLGSDVNIKLLVGRDVQEPETNSLKRMEQS